MDTGSFFRGGINVMATQGHEASFTPPLTPSVRECDSFPRGCFQSYGQPMHSHSQDPLSGMNQKLDRMLLLFLEQKSLIHRGQEETAEMKKRWTVLLPVSVKVKVA